MVDGGGIHKDVGEYEQCERCRLVVEYHLAFAFQMSSKASRDSRSCVLYHRNAIKRGIDRSAYELSKGIRLAYCLLQNGVFDLQLDMEGPLHPRTSNLPTTSRLDARHSTFMIYKHKNNSVSLASASRPALPWQPQSCLSRGTSTLLTSRTPHILRLSTKTVS